MNPLTLVKRIKEINSREAALGISEDASWHSKYKESPYVFVGGIPFDLTEGDLLAIFSQYGEIVDVNLVRDKGTGKSKGFAFVAYEDQRSTNLAVDNLNGATVLGRIIRVDHVTKYKKKEEEDEEMEQQKREERGVCRAFQRGDCTRGASCKFSHNEQRAANTGWGPKDDIPKWGHDKHEADPIKSGRMGGDSSSRIRDRHDQEESTQSDDKGRRLSRTEDYKDHRDNYTKRRERNHDSRGVEKLSEISEKEPSLKDSERQATSRNDWDRGRRDERSFRYESDQRPKENYDRKERSDRYESEPKLREDNDGKGREDRSGRQESHNKPREDHDRKERSGRYESEPKLREGHDGKGREGRSGRQESHNKPREDHDRKERSERHESESKPREGRDSTGREDMSGRHGSERNKIDDYDQRDSINKRSRYDEGLSSRRHREEDELQARRARR